MLRAIKRAQNVFFSIQFMVATVSGDNGALVRSCVVVELVPDFALVQTLLPSMVETTVLAWDRLLRVRPATAITAQV